MFDFNTTVNAPVKVRIDGVDYSVPRFLLPRLKAWAAERRAAQIEEATEGMDKQDRSRFLLYFSVPPVDVADMLRDQLTPEGIDHVVRDCLRRGGVPVATIDLLMDRGDPAMLRKLADELSSAIEAARIVDPPAEEVDGHPLPPAGGDCAASPSIGAGATPPCSNAAPASTATG